MARLIGEVKRKVTEKGFGFVRVNGQDYFMHRNQNPEFDNLMEGDKVEFDEEDGQKGKRAVGTELLN